jgi:hypothetical protein
LATLETVSKDATGKTGPGARRIRVQIRRVSPLSVLKVSLIFYACLLIVVLVGVAILLMILDAIGVLEPVESFIGDFGFGTTVGQRGEAQAVFEIDMGWVMRTLFLIGTISFALWAAFTMFMALLYNLIADLVGGVEVTLVERR